MPSSNTLQGESSDEALRHAVNSKTYRESTNVVCAWCRDTGHTGPYALCQEKTETEEKGGGEEEEVETDREIAAIHCLLCYRRSWCTLVPPCASESIHRTCVRGAH